MDMRPATILSAMTVVLGLLTSCGGSSEDPTAIQGSAAPSTTVETPSSTRSPSPSSETSDADLPSHEQSGPYDLVLKRVRVVDRDDHDRVVLSFSGTGRPGWYARFVDRAVLDGSGDVVDLDGDAILRLDISGTPTLGRRTRVRSDLGGDVVDVHAVGAFEGVTQVFVGLADGRTPFRVDALTGPSRLVVDLG
jgi:hypothetical protein